MSDLGELAKRVGMASRSCELQKTPGCSLMGELPNRQPWQFSLLTERLASLGRRSQGAGANFLVFSHS